MLTTVADSILTDTEKMAATLRGWSAVDVEIGAHLYRSAERTGNKPGWILVLHRSGQVFGGGDADYYRKIPFGSCTLDEALNRANAKLVRILATRVKLMAAESRRIAQELDRIETRNSGGVFATLHLTIE